MKDVVQKTLSAGASATFEMQLTRNKFLGQELHQCFY